MRKEENTAPLAEKVYPAQLKQGDKKSTVGQCSSGGNGERESLAEEVKADSDLGRAGNEHRLRPQKQD